MGLKYNDNKISQKSTDTQYPYYNDNQITACVYYNGNLVWKKYNVLQFTFNGNILTGYTGSSSIVYIPEYYYTVTDIDGTTFYTSDTVTGQTVTSVTSIGDDAFANNTQITTVSIPSCITTIGARAFQNCYNLSSIGIFHTPDSIGYCAFALTNLKSISSYLYNCTSLGQGCFATRNGWAIQSPSSSTGLTDDAVLNRLLATNMGAALSSNGYTGAGIVAIIRSRFNVHQNGGSNGSSGGTFTCNCRITYNNDKWVTSLDTAISFGNYDYGYTYCVASTTTPVCSETINMSSQPSNYSSWSSGCTNRTVNIGGTCDHDCYAAVTTTCLAKGTLITLANGERKPIEDIKYTDLLKVWNFETGQVDYQYPLMLAESHTNLITRLTLEDNSYIEISGVHDIYDPKLHKFIAWGNGNIPDSEVQSHTMLKLIGNEYQILKVKSLETIEKDTTCYCCMTGGTITAFANNILVGSVLLNYAGIEKTNSFGKSFANDKQICYTYDKFKEELYDKSNKYSILGLNLHYAHFYNKDVSNLPQLLAPFKIKKPLNIVNNKIQCTIGFLQGDTLTEQTISEDTVITMPEIAESNKNKWYIVGEYKYLNPGDSYTINYSTIIRAVKGENNDS